MRMKVFIIIFFLLILTSNGISFGRKRSAKCRKDSEKTLSKNDENLTVDYYYNCDPTEFGIVQKISYLRSCSTCDTIEINFSSACIRCGMCLAIADKVNPFSFFSFVLFPFPYTSIYFNMCIGLFCILSFFLSSKIF